MGRVGKFQSVHKALQQFTLRASVGRLQFLPTTRASELEQLVAV